MTNYAILQALLAALLFGIAAPFSKTLLAGLQANQLAGLLYLGAAAFLTPSILRHWKAGRRIIPTDAANRRRLLISILFGGLAGPVLLLIGLEYAMAASVSMWLSLEAVATAIIAAAFFGENIGKWTWVGNIGVVIAGAMLGFNEGQAGWMGLLCICGAAIAWGIDNNATAGIDGISPEDTTFWKGLIAGTVNLGAGLALFPWTFSAAWLWALILGGVAYGGSIALYIHAAQRVGATRAQMAFASAPFWGVVLSMALLGEGMSALQIAAGAILACSITLPALERHGHSHQHQTLSHTHMHSHDDPHHAHTHEGVEKEGSHSHFHEHEPLTHAHQHCPDLHHRHH